MNYTGTQNVTGKGQGIYNSVAGSLGLASFLGLNMNGNGCNNGGLFGLGNNSNCYVTKEENALSTALAIAQSEKESLATSKTDMERLFQELRTQDAKIADGLIQTGNAVGVLNAEVACLKESVARNREESFRNLQEAKTYTDTRVSSEAQLRQCEDEKVVLWTKSQNYVTGVNKIDPDQICGASPISSGCCY